MTATMPKYRSIRSGKSFGIWLIIRLMGLVFFLIFAVVSYRRGNIILTFMEGALALSNLLHLIDLFIQLFRLGELPHRDFY